MGENADRLLQYASTHVTSLVGLVAGALILLVFARRIAKHDRPDNTLSRIAVVLGLGWSSEAAWELMAGFPTGVRVAVFAVGEVMLIVSMIRTVRSVRETGVPGRAGRTVWIIGGAMAAVGLLAGDSFGQSILRALVPLGLTLMWWQGVVPEGARKAAGTVSWRWTPRRLLLWLGAIEPGERDVETVHRERTIQQLTKLEFRRRGAKERQHDNQASRLSARLAKASLLIDDDMIAEIRRRVARASWFTDDAHFGEIEAIQRQGEVAWRMSEQERVERGEGERLGIALEWPESVKDLIDRWDRADMGGAAIPGSPVVIPGHEQDEQNEEPDEQGDERAPKRRATPEQMHLAVSALMDGKSITQVARMSGVGASTLRRYEKVRRLLTEMHHEHPIDYIAEKVRPDVVEFMRSRLRNEHRERGERHEAGE